MVYGVWCVCMLYALYVVYCEFIAILKLKNQHILYYNAILIHSESRIKRYMLLFSLNSSWSLCNRNITQSAHNMRGEKLRKTNQIEIVLIHLSYGIFRICLNFQYFVVVVVVVRTLKEICFDIFSVVMKSVHFYQKSISKEPNQLINHYKRHCWSVLTAELFNVCSSTFHIIHTLNRNV